MSLTKAALAAFEPPTPPEAAHNDLHSGVLASHTKSPTLATNPTVTSRNTRRMPKMRYDTSDSSADSTDADSSDDEPPWWTFTQRGMAKMRARTLGHKGVEEAEGDHPATSGVESGRESGKDNRLRRGSRQSSKDKDKRSTPTPAIPNNRDRDVLAPPVNIRPRNINPHSLLWRRSAGRESPLPPMALESTPMARSNSAPVSPVILPSEAAISPGMTTLVGSVDDARRGDAEIVTKTKRSMTESRPIPMPKRQMTAPTFPRFLKRSDQDIHTDTETNGATLPRAKQREKLSDMQAPGGSLPGPSTESAGEGFTTPYRPRSRRMQTGRLRINLPDNLQQHLAAQWPGGRPHAGSWQDAYYGYYSENQAEVSSRRQSTGSKPPSRKGSDARESASITSRRPSRIRELDATPEDSAVASESATPVVRHPSRRRRTRKTRRYRTGLAPPTPSGLGFSPNGTKRDNESWKEGRVGAAQNGFDWGNNHTSAPQTDITESRDSSAAIDSQAFNEKTGAKADSVKGPWWTFGRQRKQMYSNGRAEEISWQKKLRRMIFLDARVTIYIRLFNLIVVVVSLGELYPAFNSPCLRRSPGRADSIATGSAASPRAFGCLHYTAHSVLFSHSFSRPHRHLSGILWKTYRVMGSSIQNALGVSRSCIHRILVVWTISRYQRLHRNSS